MKKLMLVVFALFLAVSVNAQQKEKKNFKAAVEAVKLTKEEAVKVKSLSDAKIVAIKAIKKQKLEKEVTKEKVRAINKANNAKIKAVLGKVKMKAWNLYWKKKK